MRANLVSGKTTREECLVVLEEKREIVRAENNKMANEKGIRHLDPNYGNQLWNDGLTSLKLIDLELAADVQPVSQGNFVLLS